MSGKDIDGHCDVELIFERRLLFALSTELQLACGRHFGTKAETEQPCAVKTVCVKAAEVMKKA